MKAPGGRTTAALVTLCLGVLIALPIVTRPGAGLARPPTPRPIEPAVVPSGTVVVDRIVDYSGDPYALSWQQARQRLYDPPSVLGFLEGKVVGDGQSILIDEGSSAFAYTDFPFKVTGYIAPAGARCPYRIGSTIVLREPSGAVNGVSYRDEGAPQLWKGFHLYVLIRDQGDQGGGNLPPLRLVVTTRGQDVYQVMSDGRVSNQNPYPPNAKSRPL